MDNKQILLGAVMRSTIARQTIESTDPDFAGDDFVRDVGRVEQYHVGSAKAFSEVEPLVKKLNRALL